MIISTTSLQTTNAQWKSWAGLLLWLLICFSIAGLGGYLTSLGLTGYYELLRKPYWTPPGYVIGMVWNVLFVMMAVAIWLVWRRVGWFHWAVIAFVVQLLLNLGWSYAFFTLQCPEMAFGELCILWLSILITAVLFWPISRLAACLMIPYLAWVLFAGGLNYTIWQMN
ncbi:MAG TPA: tryptophan-rich sensory protein [Gemmatales bacterium]|nr:tryptophan-rich sensory protein [Gemmatales bacterium]